jgi:hypothetical protein
MATSSILGGSRVPEEAIGKDDRALGTSDNSDSGSDVVGAYGEGELTSDTDAAGTGERASAGSGMETANADILPDHIEGEPAGDGVDMEAALDSVESLAADDDDEGIETT